jgi:MFS family permease
LEHVLRTRRLYYGWVVVALSFFTIALYAVFRQCFTVIFPAMLKEFAWSRTVFSLAPALFGLVTSVNAFVVGYLSDRIDVKKLIPVGAAVTALGLALCFFTRKLWHMILFYGILSALGASALTLFLHTIIVSNWFMKLRGTAIGIISSGSGAGTLAFIPLLQLVIGTWSWRAGFLALALTAGPLLIPIVILFQKSHPAQMGLQPLGGKSDSSAATPLVGSASVSQSLPLLRSREVVGRLLRNRRFWLCLLQFVLSPLSTTPIAIHQAALLQEKGLSSMGSAWVVGVYGLSLFCGMILSGALSDRIGREWSYTIGTISAIVGAVFLLRVPSGAGMVIPMFYAVFFGLGLGTRPSMDSATATDIFKGRYFGLVYGALQLGLGLGLFGGPLIGGFIYDRSGSYCAAVVFCMVVMVVATVCIWAAAPRRGREEALV